MPTRKHQMPYTAKSLSDANGKMCRNCGRSMPIRRPNQVFCNKLCKNRYHSRGVRRISQLEKELAILKRVMDVCFSISGIDTKPIYDLENKRKV